jgi:hypothetical protein
LTGFGFGFYAILIDKVEVGNRNIDTQLETVPELPRLYPNFISLNLERTKLDRGCYKHVQASFIFDANIHIQPCEANPTGIRYIQL